MRRIIPLLILLFALPAKAGLFPERDGLPIHYAYAVWFGTGWYSVAGRDVFVIRFTPTWTKRRAMPEETGLRFKFPVSVGVFDFDPDDILGAVDNVGLLAVVPGVWWRKYLKPRWSLQWQAHGGFGHEFPACSSGSSPLCPGSWRCWFCGVQARSSTGA